MAETIDFKFGIPLGFVKAHRKITLTDKIGGGRGFKKLPKFGVPL